MSRWYRAYEGTVTDPKLAEAAFIARCSLVVAIAAWHAILESAAGRQDGGRFDTNALLVAMAIRQRVPKIEALFAEAHRRHPQNNSLEYKIVYEGFQAEGFTLDMNAPVITTLAPC